MDGVEAQRVLANKIGAQLRIDLCTVVLKQVRKHKNTRGSQQRIQRDW